MKNELSVYESIFGRDRWPYGELFEKEPRSANVGALTMPYDEGEISPDWDVTSDAKNYYIKVDLPGVDKRDIDINYDPGEGLITVSGHRYCTTLEQEEHVIERYEGWFERQYFLDNVDHANINATFKNGVLDITIPKDETKKPQRISINVGDSETGDNEVATKTDSTLTDSTSSI